MQPVVQAKCPACKQVLRIPANWVQQTLKCKHCGATIQARSKSGSSGRVPSPSKSSPPPEDASPFADMTAPLPVAPAPPRRRKKTSSRALVLPLILLGGLLLMGVTGYVVIAFVIPRVS